MTADVLSGMSGVALSLIFAYLPGVKPWFIKQSGEIKRLIMLVCLLLIAGVIFGLSCYGWIDGAGIDAVSCDKVGAWALLRAFLAALVANQATFTIIPKE